MGWERLLEQRRVEQAEADVDEIRQLLQLASRALADAHVRALSPEGRFECAYEAARALATALIRASGYRVRAMAGAHHNTFAALRAVQAGHFQREAGYFNLCREKRNEMSYVQAVVVSDAEAEELVAEVTAFRIAARNELHRSFPELGEAPE